MKLLKISETSWKFETHLRTKMLPVKCLLIFSILGLSSPALGLREYSKQDLENLRQQVKEVFYHAYNGYLNNAFPYDELRPLSCDGIDTWGSYSLTLIDALDTLAIMGNYTEFIRVVQLITERANFDININVSVFETNIRIVGGLLSAHLFYKKAGVDLPPGWPCNGPLLRLAEDVARRLLPAFDTDTGMPFGTVNLRYGVPTGETPVTCTAGVGTYIIEFGTLSRLTGDPIYEEVALRALRSLYKRKSNIGLFGNHIDTKTGIWTAQDSGIGAGVDSYFEYLVKGAILFQRPELLAMFNEIRGPIEKYLKRDDWYLWVSMYKGQVTLPVFQSLEAFWPGVLSLVGDVSGAMKSLHNYHQVWKQYGFLPEFYNIVNSEAGTNRESYPLRPELIESVMYLFRATGDPYLLDVGQDMLNSIQHSARTPCGYATIRNVLDHSQEDRMESFFLAETTKYLYLLFDTENFIHDDGNQGNIFETDAGKMCVLGAGGYIFNTEAHPVDVSALQCCSSEKLSDMNIELAKPRRQEKEAQQLKEKTMSYAKESEWKDEERDLKQDTENQAEENQTQIVDENKVAENSDTRDATVDNDDKAFLKFVQETYKVHQRETDEIIKKIIEENKAKKLNSNDDIVDKTIANPNDDILAKNIVNDNNDIVDRRMANPNDAIEAKKIANDDIIKETNVKVVEPHADQDGPSPPSHANGGKLSPLDERYKMYADHVVRKLEVAVDKYIAGKKMKGEDMSLLEGIENRVAEIEGQNRKINPGTESTIDSETQHQGSRLLKTDIKRENFNTNVEIDEKVASFEKKVNQMSNNVDTFDESDNRNNDKSHVSLDELISERLRIIQSEYSNLDDLDRDTLYKVLEKGGAQLRQNQKLIDWMMRDEFLDVKREMTKSEEDFFKRLENLEVLQARLDAMKKSHKRLLDINAELYNRFKSILLKQYNTNENISEAEKLARINALVVEMQRMIEMTRTLNQLDSTNLSDTKISVNSTLSSPEDNDTNLSGRNITKLTLPSGAYAIIDHTKLSELAKPDENVSIRADFVEENDTDDTPEDDPCAGLAMEPLRLCQLALNPPPVFHPQALYAKVLNTMTSYSIPGIIDAEYSMLTCPPQPFFTRFSLRGEFFEPDAS